uniref:C3H1-type domain-containing protein n=1 Tax=Lygus hesperus TaxID=30085 RepID=A0A146LET0_LYGHE
MCELGGYIVYLFSNQRQSSRHVMLTHPSPYFQQTHGLPPPLPPLPVPRAMTQCPVYEAYGFCPYSIGCYLPHTLTSFSLPPSSSSLPTSHTHCTTPKLFAENSNNKTNTGELNGLGQIKPLVQIGSCAEE